MAFGTIEQVPRMDRQPLLPSIADVLIGKKERKNMKKNLEEAFAAPSLGLTDYSPVYVTVRTAVLLLPALS